MRFHSVLGVSLCLFNGLIWCPVQAQQNPVSVQVIKAYWSDANLAREYAAVLDTWEFNRDDGYFVAPMNGETMEMLRAAGFRLEVMPKLTRLYDQGHERLPGQVRGINGYPCYRTVEETFQAAQDLVLDHPGLAEWIDVGDSWEHAQDPLSGYPMMVLKITNQSIPGPKPALFVMSAVHARELTTAELNTRFAEFLLNGYGENAEATWLVDHREIHLLLQSNPDGRKIAETGEWQRKNRNNNECSTGNFGIDLNRNFPFHWGCCNGSSGDPCSDTYRGLNGESEPETLSITEYVRTIMPDQRDDDLNSPAPQDAQGIFVDLHSYSELVLWPWGFTSQATGNGTALQTLGRKLAFFNGYEPDQAIGLYATDGTTVDFAYGELGVASFVVELGTSFFQDCQSFEDRIFPDNLNLLIYGAKACDAPYQRPAGPDAVNLQVAFSGYASGTLTATLNDTRYEDQNGSEPSQDIAQAWYSLEGPPATAAQSHAMTAVDGSFDASVEDVEAAVQFSNSGKHALFVQGVDGDGNWGVASSTFVYVADQDTEIRGFVTSAEGQPLAALITAGGFQTQSDALSGGYVLFVAAGTYDVEVSAMDHEVKTLDGIQVPLGQNVDLNVTLVPYCDLLCEDAESGTGAWTAEGQWAIIQGSHAQGGAHCWTDSPDGNYGDQWDVSLVSPLVDLTGTRAARLGFWTQFNLESGWDYGYVEYRLGADGPWQTLTTLNGESSWKYHQFDVPGWVNQDQLQIRFRLDTDGSVTRDGWYLDDIRIQALGGPCPDFMSLQEMMNVWPHQRCVLDMVSRINADAAN